MKINIVIATIGKPSLIKTLKSIKPQMTDGDEIICMVDGKITPEIKKMWSDYGVGKLIGVTGPHNDWGMAMRNLSKQFCDGDIICFIDDDDFYFDDALMTIREESAKTPHVPLLFQMIWKSGRVIFDEKLVTCGNVSTQMIVLPRALNTELWGDRYEGDFDYIAATVDRYGVRWVNQIICQYGK